MSIGFTIKVNPMKNASALLAFADVTFGDVVVVPGWKVWKGKDGSPYAQAPSNPGISGKDENGHLIPKKNEQGQVQYQDAVRFIDEKESPEARYTPFHKNVLDEIVSEYLRMGGSQPSQQSNKMPSAAPKTKNQPSSVKAIVNDMDALPWGV